MKEGLVWVSLDEDVSVYPEFFRTELKNPTDIGAQRLRGLLAGRLRFFIARAGNPDLGIRKIPPGAGRTPPAP